MDRDAFRTVVKALITRNGKVLLGRKREEPGHPISGQFHFLGGHVHHGEDLDGALEREVMEETGLTVEAEEVIDVSTFSWQPDDDRNALQVLYHCTVEDGTATAQDDLAEVRWVEPEEVIDTLGGQEAGRVRQRERQLRFLEQL